MDESVCEKMKIFIGVCETAGYGHNLKKGFESLGINVESSFREPYIFGYNKDEQKYYFKFYNFLYRKIKPDFLRNAMLFCLKRFASMFVFPYFLLTRDVFIFIYGYSFFPKNFDLPILKLFKKKIIAVFLGDDTRCDIISGSCNIKEKFINRKIKKIRMWERYADKIIVNPLSSQMHVRNSINWFAIGIPFENPFENVNYSVQSKNEINNNHGKFTLLHASSNMKVKGTYKIREVIKELKTELKDNFGIEIEYIELSGVPNQVVLKTIQKCDLVIEQLYSDTYLATLGTEAAFFGKASVVGTYGKENMKKYFNYPNQIVFLVDPDNLHEELKSIITNPEKIKVVGNNAKKFVRDEQNPKKIAEKFISLIENNYPESWNFDPQEVDYWMGCGISKNDLINRLQNEKIDLDKIDLPKNNKLIKNLKLIRNKK